MKRTALITGASAGLGLEFARQFASQGMGLVLVARRREKLEAAAEELRNKYGVSVQTVSADLSDPEAPKRLYETTQAEGLQIDYLINNAGSAGPHLFEEPDWKPQRDFLELMILSVPHLCHYFIPGMKARGFGRVINVASVAGRIPRAAGGHYGPSKAYIVALSEELGMILRGTGVHVSALCPGFTHTEFHERADLAEMKSGMPDFVWYDAETVVREGIMAVERNRVIQVSGRLYRWIDPFLQSVFVRPLIKAFTPGR